MSQTNQTATAKQTIESLTKELTNLEAQKSRLHDQLDTVKDEIKARRNALQGVQLGQKWQQEINTEKAEAEKNNKDS